jgi:quaternary ammonium compound-resistance protein SugE
MAWVVLFVAGVLEIGWALGLKSMGSDVRVWPAIGTGVALVASMVLLGVALRTLPLGTAYAIWTGIGIVGTALVGMLFFREPVSAPKLLGIALIIVGIGVTKIVSAR